MRATTNSLPACFCPNEVPMRYSVKFSQLDIKRLLIFSAWGGFGFTPIAYNWYNIIEATIPVSVERKFLRKRA